MLSVDVRCTLDEVLVLSQQAVHKVAGREVMIRQRTLEEWQDYLEATHNPLTTLEEAFDLAEKRRVSLMIQMRDPEIESLVGRAIRNYGFNYMSVLVTTMDDTSRTIMRSLDPKIPLGHWLDNNKPPKLDTKYLEKIDADAIVWHHKLITPTIVQMMHNRHILVYPWLVNLADEMRRLRNTCKVDGILTDMPDLLRAI